MFFYVIVTLLIFMGFLWMVGDEKKKKMGCLSAGLMYYLVTAVMEIH